MFWKYRVLRKTPAHPHGPGRASLAQQNDAPKPSVNPERVGSARYRPNDTSPAVSPRFAASIPHAPSMSLPPE